MNCSIRSTPLPGIPQFYANPGDMWRNYLMNATRVDQAKMDPLSAIYAHLDTAVSHVPTTLLHAPSALFLEFGVREGGSITHQATKHPTITFDGFDSWEGLPGNANDRGTSVLHWGKGQFDSAMPKVPSNVRLHRGFFDATLPPFLDSLPTHPRPKASFVHFDADLYSSTAEALCALCSRCMLAKGTVLSFDELYGKNLPALAEHEWRALHEASASCGFSFQFITWMLFNGPATRYARAAVQITDVGPHCRHAHGHTEASGD